MNKLTTTILSVLFVLFAAALGYSMSMDKTTSKADEMSASQPMQDDSKQMKSNVMQKEQDKTDMTTGDMEKTSDGMMNDNKDDMKKGNMKKDQTMVPTDEQLRARLTPLQYQVTRMNGTEPPYDNAYWSNHEPGIYVDIISGAPLFSSTDKYDSGTGWPSFTKPLDPDQVVEQKDRGFFSSAVEVRSKTANAHLGHVFDDGPAPTGLRYCINSAALRFVPAADLKKDGYGQYAALFK